jgi:hypothetical protein
MTEMKDWSSTTLISGSSSTAAALAFVFAKVTSFRDSD